MYMHFGGPTSVCLSCDQHRSWQLDNLCMGSARSLMGCLHPTAMLRGCAHGKRRQKEAQREAEEMHKRVQEAEAEAARKGTYAAALARKAVRVASIQVRLAAWRGSGRQDKLAQHTALHDSVLLAQPKNRSDRCRHCQAACASGRTSPTATPTVLLTDLLPHAGAPGSKGCEPCSCCGRARARERAPRASAAS